MPWGRIDDAFDDDPRVLRLLAYEDGDRALALWTLCFTWANRNTRKRGKTPGLLPYHLPLSKLGPSAYRLADLLVQPGVELWAWAEKGRPDAGWIITDFAESLPDEDVRRKRAEAGRRGAAKRWGNRDQPAAPPAPPAEVPPVPVNPQVEDLPAFDTPGRIGGDGTLLPTDSNCHNLPMATSVLPSVCYDTPTPTGSKVPSNDGNLLPTDGTLLQLAEPADMCEAAAYGTLLSIDGRLPLIDSTLPSPGSKTPPHSLSLSLKEKDSLSPPDGGGVIALHGFTDPTPAPPQDGADDTATTAADATGARTEYTREFETFWDAYGRRGAKRAAAVQWAKAIRRATPATIMAAVPAYVAATPELRFRKHAERWLRDDGWLSTVAPARQVVGGAPFRNPTEAAFYDTGI